MFSKVTKRVVAVTLVCSLALATALITPATTKIDAAKKFKLNKKKVTLKVAGKAVKLKGVNGKVSKWSTSKKAVATVKKGKVTPVGAGSCVITATSGSSKATCKVTVKAAAKGTVIYDLAKETGRDTSTNESYAPPQVRKYEKFKYNWCTWLCRATFYDPAVGTSDYRGKTIRCDISFKNAGKNTMKEILFQLNYTKPKAYPIVKKFKKIKKGKTVTTSFTFKIPADAINTDKDSATGLNFPIMFYCTNKGADEKSLFQTGDVLTIKKCKFTVVK